MSQTIPTPELDDCGCCDTDVPALSHPNPPGQPALRYRLGTHGVFMRRMLSRIANTAITDGPHQGKRPLSALTTRDAGDPAIALLDAWAVLADVLCFYQERIANEGYLRTASERLSVLELARAIGYELNPGVAASAYVAFTVEDAPGAPETALLPQGTKVQSVPEPGDLPQTFETSTEFVARAAFNTLKPRLTQAQNVSSTQTALYLAGTAANLQPGDKVLLVTGSSSAPTVTAKQVFRVTIDADADHTRIDFTAVPQTPVPPLPTFTIQGSVGTTQIPPTSANVQSHILEKWWSDQDLNAFLSFHEWDAADLGEHLADLRKAGGTAVGGEVFALRERLAFFGNNAPYYSSLPVNSANVISYPGQDWDKNGWEIWKDQLKNTYWSGADVYLERPVSGLLPGSWLLVQPAAGAPIPYWVTAVSERSQVGFALSGKVSGLTLAKSNKTALGDNSTDKPAHLKIRESTVQAKSELLALVDLPITDYVETTELQDGNEVKVGVKELTLDILVLGLAEGQAVAVTGEQVDAKGVVQSEIAMLKEITHAGGYTTLTFAKRLQYRYRRETLTINGNVVAATHGETVQEVLGSGNGAVANQRFVLRKPPLTYVSAATTTGGESTLTVRVAGVLWSISNSLYESLANDEHFIVRLDDDGKAHVIFGDGQKGTRLPTGSQNVTATYRSGTGLAGEVAAGALTLLQTRPAGIKAVTNPTAASGAAEPETLASARTSAPLTVRTLERIVSLQDFEDFARSFAGVGKAKTVVLWNSENSIVHITIATASGKPVAPSATLIGNLQTAMDNARDPTQQVAIDTYTPLSFNLAAKVLVDGRYVTKTVLDDVKSALLEAFSFDQRAFGQLVTSAEVITVLQNVTGVIAVDLDRLYLASDTTGPSQTTPPPLLPASVARWQTDGTVGLAELLLINPYGITLQEMTS